MQNLWARTMDIMLFPEAYLAESSLKNTSLSLSRRLNQFEIVHNKQLDVKRDKSLRGYTHLGKVCIAFLKKAH